MLTVPHVVKPLRWAVIAVGVALLLWMSREENSVRSVTLFGLAVSSLGLAVWISDRFAGRRIPARLLPAFAVITGAVFGLSTGIVTTGLMLLKSALHSHVVPDYPPELMGAILERIPAWTVAGALSGLALALFWLALHPEATSSTHPTP
jgi:hypothetical protein